MFDILEKVLKPFGPSGMETAVANTVRKEIEPFVDTIETDAMGNLIATKAGTDPNGKKIMFSAHMDHIGFVVTGYEKGGFLRVAPVGGVSVDMSRTRHVSFENGSHGVVVCQPVKGAAQMTDLFIDIGAQDEDEARTMVRLGDMAVYANDCFRLGQNRVASPAMDDRCAVALLVKLLQTVGETKDTIVALFSVQEEVGCRGAKVASFAKEPDIGIALDVTAWGDTPEVTQPAIKLGEGVAVKVMDKLSISHPALREALIEAGEQAGVKVQREVLAFGGTDAGSMQTSRGGIPVCTVSIPCRYVHSACEVIDMRDMDAALTMLKAWLNK
ncbi:MAG: M20/M25/M40 family metallo-hydrolase [Clostridia bacterium]|nr:M20/M25/M40 family metallo-hydrolase [Clostridia bacterium]